MLFELGIQVWKIMSFRWRPSSWMQFSFLPLKSSIARASSCWSIVSTSCWMTFFNSFKLRGLWEYTRPFRYPPEEEITWWQVRRHWGPWHMAETRNEAPREHVCHHVISSSGDIWRAVCTLTNHVIWTSWRMSSSKKCSRSINSCWPERWTISSGGLKTAFKRMVVT